MILIQTAFVTGIVTTKVNDRNKNENTMEKNNATKTTVSWLLISAEFQFSFLVLYLVSLKLVAWKVNERQSKRKQILKKYSIKRKTLYSRATSLRNSALE